MLVSHLFALAYLCEKRTYVLAQMHLCFSLNALAFGLECTCVLIQTALRFELNELAFFKELRVLLFSAIGEVCREYVCVFF